MSLNELIKLAKQMGINFDAPLVIYDEGMEHATFQTLADALPIILEEDTQITPETFNYSRYINPIFKRVKTAGPNTLDACILIFSEIQFHKNQDLSNLKDPT